MTPPAQQTHLLFWVEERSMAAFLESWFGSCFPSGISVGKIIPFSGKQDLLTNLEKQIRGYQKVNVPHLVFRHIVLVDSDDEDCIELKRKVTKICRKVGLSTRVPGSSWEAAVCIVMKELEAWFFGNWDAVRSAYPKAPEDIPRKAAYRVSDKIKEKNSKALEKILLRSKCIKGGLRKIETAELIGSHFVSENCNSTSFKYFHRVLNDAASLGA